MCTVPPEPRDRGPPALGLRPYSTVEPRVRADTGTSLHLLFAPPHIDASRRKTARRVSMHACESTSGLSLSPHWRLVSTQRSCKNAPGHFAPAAHRCDSSVSPDDLLLISTRFKATSLRPHRHCAPSPAKEPLYTSSALARVRKATAGKSVSRMRVAAVSRKRGHPDAPAFLFVEGCSLILLQHHRFWRTIVGFLSPDLSFHNSANAPAYCQPAERKANARQALSPPHNDRTVLTATHRPETISFASIALLWPTLLHTQTLDTWKLQVEYVVFISLEGHYASTMTMPDETDAERSRMLRVEGKTIPTSFEMLSEKIEDQYLLPREAIV